MCEFNLRPAFVTDSSQSGGHAAPRGRAGAGRESLRAHHRYLKGLGDGIQSAHRARDRNVLLGAEAYRFLPHGRRIL
jgi:hypothetical protein